MGAQIWHLTAKNFEIATFKLRDRQLRFKWAEKLPGLGFDPRSLRNCLLVVTKNGSEQPVAQIALRMPITTEKVPVLGFLDRKAVTLPVQLTDLPDPLLQQLRWQFVPGTIGDSDDLPQVAFAEPDQGQPATESDQAQPAGLFSVTIPGEEPIRVSAKSIKFAHPAAGLQVAFDPHMESSSPINPPWAKSIATPFEKERIRSLREQARQRLAKAKEECRKTYSNVDVENPQPALKHNSETLRAREQRLDSRRQQIGGEKLTPENRSELSKLGRDIGYLQGLVQRLEFIIEVRSYLDRLDRLEKGFDALGRVYVGYRIYLPMGEDGDEPLLLVEGAEDPLEAKPHGAGKKALVAEPAEAAIAPPVAGSDDEAGKPPAADSGTKNDQADSPKSPEEGE